MKLKSTYRRRVIRRVALGLAVCAAVAPAAQGAYVHEGEGSSAGAGLTSVVPDDRAARPSGVVVTETAQRPDDRAVRPTAETSPSGLPAYSIDGPRSGPATNLPLFSIDGPRTAPDVVVNPVAQAPAADNGIDWRIGVGIGLGALAALMAAAALVASRRRGTFQGA